MKARSVLTVLVFAALSVQTRGAIVAAPGYAVHTIPTPGTVQGGVVRRGEAILVGQGSFGAGMETIIRLDDNGPTTIATGFNSLGGFDLDPAGTLYAVDNCLECSGATTGDTLYAIPKALMLMPTMPVAAASVEVLPAGSIPSAADILIAPTGAALVSDAVGNGAGHVWRVVSGAKTDLIQHLDLVGGGALAPDGTLRLVNAVLNPDFSTTGAVLEYQLDGTFQGTLVGGLQGGFGAAIDGDGNVLVSGIGSFGDSKVIAVAPDGSVTERATGFTFSGDLFFDSTREEALVIDFGKSEITAIGRERAKLKIGKLASIAGDMLKLKGEMTVPSFLPAPDPVANGARIRIDGAAGNLLDATIPGGPGWETSRAGTAWTYRNPSGILGIGKVVVKTAAKVPGLVKFLVVGKDGNYPVAPSDLPLRATMVLDPPSVSTGLSVEASFAACAFNDSGNTLRCH